MENNIRQYLKVSSHIIRNRLGSFCIPSFVTFLVTFRCNHKCIMCDVWKHKNHNEMSIDQIEHIFRQLKHLDAIRLSGGEPFLHKNLLDIINIIQKESSPSIIHITSNGLLTDKIKTVLSRVDNLSSIHLKISIDAVGSNHDRIRGTTGAWERALNTLEMLGEFRARGLYVAVNQTIADRSSIDDMDELAMICNKYKFPLFMQIAYDDSTLYMPEKNISSLPDKKGEFSTFYKFRNEELKLIMDKLQSEIEAIPIMSERVLKKYYTKGISNRLIHGKAHPNPRCVALRNHLRILPDGKVPICLYDSTIVGDLTKQSVRDLLTSKEAKQACEKVNKCKGCWAECEVVPSAVYTGDFIRAFSY